jgi:prepilin-type N-terminal cleavage/methylation domain-containing protein
MRYKSKIQNRKSKIRGFTLVELLVVITIILLITVAALPTVLPALSHRQVSEAARLIQAALVGARDDAIHNNAPSGIRLLPDPILSGINTNRNSPLVGRIDPTQILAVNRIIPIQTPPDYSEGHVSIAAPPVTVANSFNAQDQQQAMALTYPGPGGGLYPLTNVLMVEENMGAFAQVGGPFIPDSPTGWWWNIRVGDKIQINNAGPWYTVIGPEASANPEGFTNVGVAGTLSPLVRNYGTGANPLLLNPEFLFLVNGVDDNKNGWVDEGWDGTDNDGDGLIDEVTCGLNPGNGPGTAGGEWIETEQWLGAAATQVITRQSYTIRRRPAPGPNAREIALPSNVVIDLTTWGSTLERSRLPAGAFNPLTGSVDILLNPDGTVVPTTLFSSASSFGMAGAFFHLWLAEREDLYAPQLDAAGNAVPLAGANTFLLPVTPVPQTSPLFYGGPFLKGEYRLVSLFSRTGQVTTNSDMPFLVNGLYNTGNPYLQAQQGVQGGGQ